MGQAHRDPQTALQSTFYIGWNWARVFILLFLVVFAGLLGFYLPPTGQLSHHDISRASLEQLASHCKDIVPISSDEFLDRQIKLAEVLYASGGTAYIAEPGPNTQYFANFSRSQWPLSERPFLFVIAPMMPDTSNFDKVLPQITIVTPKVCISDHLK